MPFLGSVFCDVIKGNDTSVTMTPPRLVTIWKCTQMCFFSGQNTAIFSFLSCLYSTSFPLNAATRNADGGQEVIFYWISSLTNSHCADVFYCFQATLPKRQQDFFFFSFFSFFTEWPRLMFAKEKKNEADPKTPIKKIHLHPSSAVGEEQSQIIPLCVYSHHFVKLAICGFLYVALQIIYMYKLFT